MADDLPEELARMVEWGKDMKEDRVADASTMEDESLPPVLQFLRSGEPIAVCFCPQVSRDAALQAAKIGVPGYSADELFVMLDTYAATNTFEAEFGRRPDPGELQRLYEQGRTDLVTEQLTLIRTTKAFKQSHVFLDYEVERSAMPRRIHWSEERVVVEDDATAVATGRVPDFLKDCFTQTPLADMPEYPRAEDFGLTPEEAQLHRDIAMTKILTMAGFMVAMATKSDEEREILKHSIEMESTLALTDTDGTEIVTAGGDLTGQDVLGLMLKEKLEAERGSSQQADERRIDRNRAQRRRDEAEARRKARS